MPAKNKAAGNAAEYYVREQFQEAGFDVDRGWGSDGRAMGEVEEVDLRVNVVPPIKLQVKRRKAIAKYILPNEEAVDAQILYKPGMGSNHRKVYAIIPLSEYIKLLYDREALKLEQGDESTILQ